MKSEYLKKQKLPDKPGVYSFKRGKEILYIGKATSLKDRVKSYFGKDLVETRGPILVEMVFKADKIKYQITDSVLEAIILEANLIKKYQPHYNTKEKDDKSFNYVCITKEKLPRVIIVRGKNLKPEIFNKVFGPYTSGLQLKEALKIIRPTFPFLDDKSKNYYKFYKQVGLVPDISTKEGIKKYRKNIKNLELFFEGKKKQVVRNLKKEMSEYVKTYAFEAANEAKKQLFSLKHINDIALLKNRDKKENTSFRIEAYDIAHMGGKNMVGVMVVVLNSEVEKNEYRKFKIKTQDNANDTGALMEVLKRRLAHTEWRYPNLIVMDGSIAQINVAKKTLRDLKLNIPVVSVVKDEHHKAKAIMGDKKIIALRKQEILLANSEAHRFAIVYHKKMRNRNFLK